jgi:hypothetical protein
MLAKIQSFYGFTKMPFGRDIAPGQLHRHHGHAEAVARLTWAITTRSVAVLTGEVGAGKTEAVRAALAGTDPVRYRPVYLPNPAGDRHPRHLPADRHRLRPHARVSTRGQNTDSQLDELAAYGCGKIFTDKVTGKLAERPELDKAPAPPPSAPSRRPRRLPPPAASRCSDLASATGLIQGW